MGRSCTILQSCVCLQIFGTFIVGDIVAPYKEGMSSKEIDEALAESVEEDGSKESLKEKEKSGGKSKEEGKGKVQTDEIMEALGKDSAESVEKSGLRWKLEFPKGTTFTGKGKPPKVWILQSSERDQSETKPDIPLKSETTHNESLEEDWTRTRSLNKLLEADETNRGRSVNKQKPQGKEKKVVGPKRATRQGYPPFNPKG